MPRIGRLWRKPGFIEQRRRIVCRIERSRECLGSFDERRFEHSGSQHSCELRGSKHSREPCGSEHSGSHTQRIGACCTFLHRRPGSHGHRAQGRGFRSERRYQS